MIIKRRQVWNKNQSKRIKKDKFKNKFEYFRKNRIIEYYCLVNLFVSAQRRRGEMEEIMKLSLKKYFIKSLFAMITVLSMSVVTSFALNNKAKVNLKPGQKTAMSGVVGTGKRAQYYCKIKSQKIC